MWHIRETWYCAYTGSAVLSGPYYNFRVSCTAWTVGFPTVSAWYPNPSLGLALQACPCMPQTTTAPEAYGYYADVGTVPTFYEPADSTPLGVLPHRVDPATCVRVKKTL